MKKIIIISIVIIGVSSAAFLLAGDAGIDKNFLTNNPFKSGTIISNGEIIFQKDGTYSIEYGSEGINWYDKGTYSIKKDKVYLKPKVCSSHKGGDVIDCSGSMGEAVCSVQSDANNMYYYKFFVCTSQKNKNAISTNVANMNCPVENSKIMAGMSKFYKGIPVVTMGQAKGSTTTSVKIREKPSINSKSLEYIKELFAPDSVQQSVPANTEVIMIARTRDRDKVQNWNNYWYLVNVGVMNEVWMYGEFVKVN
jgi:hypothetical protein